MLTLLTYSYHDKPCTAPDAKPIVWIDDVTAFILQTLSSYVAEKLTQFSQEAIVIDWVMFQETPSTGGDDKEGDDNIHPLISFLRNAYRTTTGDLDAAWKLDCKHYLSKKCASIGLSPSLCSLDDMINAITSLQPPDLEGGLTTMTYQLLHAKPVQCLKSSSITGLIDKRNQTIAAFQQNRSKSQWDDIKSTVKNLFIIEEVFQIFFQHHPLTLFIDSMTDSAATDFKKAHEHLQQNISAFYDPSPPPSWLSRLYYSKPKFDMQSLLQAKTQ